MTQPWFVTGGTTTIVGDPTTGAQTWCVTCPCDTPGGYDEIFPYSDGDLDSTGTPIWSFSSGPDHIQVMSNEVTFPIRSGSGTGNHTQNGQDNSSIILDPLFVDPLGLPAHSRAVHLEFYMDDITATLVAELTAYSTIMSAGAHTYISNQSCFVFVQTTSEVFTMFIRRIITIPVISDGLGTLTVGIPVVTMPFAFIRILGTSRNVTFSTSGLNTVDAIYTSPNASTDVMVNGVSGTIAKVMPTFAYFQPSINFTSTTGWLASFDISNYPAIDTPFAFRVSRILMEKVL